MIKFKLELIAGLAVLAVSVVMYYLVSSASPSADLARLIALLQLPVSEMKIWHLLVVMAIYATLFD